ncbi:radical SAM protein [bacterium]|nr:radical SAM protein [bacterium]
MRIVERLVSLDGSIKYIFQNYKGYYCEAIYYRLPPKNNAPYERYHICISSQFGCKMRCSFCDTGNLGFCHNLSCNEMLEEINLVRQDIIQSGTEKSSTKYSAVIMGMGEPLNNIENITNFCSILTAKDPKLETIPISSVGIVPQIPRIAQTQNKLKNIKFFISLHSPYDEQRSQIMPTNKRYNISSLLSACRQYHLDTNTKVTLSYMLMEGVNDTDKHMRDLTKLITPEHFKVQILLYNSTTNSKFVRPAIETANLFNEYMNKNGISSIIRVSQGQDINGGCGQLIALQKNKQK